jgi:hypothetical protein
MSQKKTKKCSQKPKERKPLKRQQNLSATINFISAVINLLTTVLKIIGIF